MFAADTLALAAVLALVVQVLLNFVWTPKLLGAGLRIYSRDVSLPSQMTIREIDAEIAKLKSPRFAHRVISDLQIGIRRRPRFVDITGIHGLITVSNGVRVEALLGWPALLFYVLVLAFFSVQVDSLFKMIIPTIVVVLIPLVDVARIKLAISQLESGEEASANR